MNGKGTIASQLPRDREFEGYIVSELVGAPQVTVCQIAPYLSQIPQVHWIMISVAGIVGPGQAWVR